jgi:phage baseplate assembly protein gpV
MKANTVTIIVGGNEIIVDSKGVSINASKITLNGTTTINGI